jgi:hypothetical protein
MRWPNEYGEEEKWSLLDGWKEHAGEVFVKIWIADDKRWWSDNAGWLLFNKPSWVFLVRGQRDYFFMWNTLTPFTELSREMTLKGLGFIEITIRP